MNENGLKPLLIVFQYASIIVSGTLGLLGILFNFKDKDTGRLTKWGRIACIVLISSLCIGITSKTIELELQSKKENSEVTRARIASEQTLKIVTNVERTSNAIKDVKIKLDLSIPLSADIFKDFRAQIHEKLGLSNDDRDLDLNSFTNLIHESDLWKQIAYDLTHTQVVIKIYPKGIKVPSCIIEPVKSIFDDSVDKAIHFGVGMNVKSIRYPQLDEIFGINFKGRVVPSLVNRPILSLVDFNDATIIIYIYTNSVQKEIRDSSIINKSKNSKYTIYYEHIPSLQYNDCSIKFSFDENRSVSVLNFKYVFDTCSKYPYFIGHTPVIIQ